ncbi:MAG TPA: hypothetical protein VNX15_13030 [Gemmatimonadales bacterium]|jgi:hypothetical protein|nr:hypothetical protein [Gemmatimonadales bacterium]
MCDRRAAGGVLAALLTATALSGQALDSARLHHRADSLLALWREANTFAEVQQTLREDRRGQVGRQTRATAALRGENPVKAGDLMVIADFPDSIPLREAARRAWAILASTYAGEATVLVSQPIRLAVMFANRQPITVLSARRIRKNVSTEELERTLLGLAGQPRVDRRFSSWLGNTVRPVFDTAAEQSAVYVQLVTAGAAAATRCFEGSVAGCSAALQLAEDSEFYLTAFDALQRRTAVAGARSRQVLEPTALATYSLCVDHHVDSACVGFLHGIGAGQVPQPLSSQARNLLVSTALSLGGVDAYDRLMADSTAPVIARLERAAHAPIDKVVGEWRARIIAARPAVQGIPLRGAIVTLGWVGLIAIGAIRSTRWRLS